MSNLSKGLGPGVNLAPKDLWLLPLLFISLSPLYSHTPHAVPTECCGGGRRQEAGETSGPDPDPDPIPKPDSYSASMAGDSDVATSTATFSCWRHKNISALPQQFLSRRSSRQGDNRFRLDLGTCIRVRASCCTPALLHSSCGAM